MKKRLPMTFFAPVSADALITLEVPMRMMVLALAVAA